MGHSVCDKYNGFVVELYENRRKTPPSRKLHTIFFPHFAQTKLGEWRTDDSKRRPSIHDS